MEFSSFFAIDFALQIPPITSWRERALGRVVFSQAFSQQSLAGFLRVPRELGGGRAQREMCGSAA
jgi:hypothetical protein